MRLTTLEHSLATYLLRISEHMDDKQLDRYLITVMMPLTHMRYQRLRYLVAYAKLLEKQKN